MIVTDYAIKPKRKYSRFILDDFRKAKKVNEINGTNYVFDGIWTNYTEAVTWCKAFGCPNYIAFDHDLGEEKTGFDFAKWLVEQDLMNPGFIPADFSFGCQSSNPSGRVNIVSYLNNYLEVISR